MIGTNRKSGFLSDIYLNTFNKQEFDSFTSSDMQPETFSIINQFQELIKDYSMADLEKNGTIPDQLWQGLKDIGIFGLNIPKEYGGKGLSLREYLRVIEAVANTDLALAIIPTAHLSIGVKGILLFGNELQKKQYLPLAASGEMVFAYALTEPNTGSDAKHIETKAELTPDGNNYILNGNKTYITNGGYAGGFVIFAKISSEKEGFLGAFIVESKSEGVKVGSDMPKMGLTISSTTSISFRNVRVSANNLIGKPGDGFKIAMAILNYGRLGLGAASTGVMHQSIKDMLKRASTRKQFGQTINQFELIQEKIVKAKVYCHIAAAMTNFTAYLLENDPLAPVAIESSHTKLFSTTRAWDTLYDALQVSGGSGYLSTQPYEKRMRDFRVTTIFEGTTEIHTIYPALLLSKALGLKLKGSKKGKIKQLVQYLKLLLQIPEISLNFKDKTARETVKTTKDYIKQMRDMLYKGILRYGNQLTEKEFFLRRVTHLSLYFFGIVCFLAKINSDAKQGRNVQEEIIILRYFIMEAKENLQANTKSYDGFKEALHHKIFNNINQ